MNLFRVVIADPAWTFADNLGGSKGMANPSRTGRARTVRGAAAKYAVMYNEQIMRLPVHRWVADNAVLVLWVPGAMLSTGLLVMDWWGFRQKQIGVWAKVWTSGKRQCGMGRQMRSGCEVFLLGTRGRPQRQSKSELNIFDHRPLKPHSRKPPNLHEMLERMYPEGPFLELFATQPRAGWTTVGLDCEGGVKADLRTWAPAAEDDR